MQIVCPNCTTSYQIADAAVGANGRSVRCVRCQIVWHAAPPAVTARGGLAGSGAPDETVAAFRVAPGGEPAAPPEPAPIEPSLDDLVGSNASEDVTDTAATAPAEAPAFALADIPIPVEDAPPLVPGGGTARRS